MWTSSCTCQGAYLPYTVRATSVLKNSLSSNGSSSSPKQGGAPTPIGAIVGGVVGGLVVMTLIVGVLIWRWRYQPTQDKTTSEHKTYVGDVDCDGKESYVSSGSPGTWSLNETHEFAPQVNSQNPRM